METLAKLFGGQARVKIMRLFLLNQDDFFTVEDVASRSRVSISNARKEINALIVIGFVKSKVMTITGSRGAKKKVNTFSLNVSFQYLSSLRDLLVDSSLLLQSDLPQRFKAIGKIKLMVVSGIFVSLSKSRVDLLIVCDKVRKNVLVQLIKNLEAEIGKELDYVLFDTEEFKYRLDMYDKLVCDIIDLPHEKLIDTGSLSTYISKK